jgi:hypothetical protein
MGTSEHKEGGVRRRKKKEWFSRSLKPESTDNITAPKPVAWRVLLTELLVRQKHFGVSRLKKYQTHFFQLPVRRQKVFNRSR